MPSFITIIIVVELRCVPPEVRSTFGSGSPGTWGSGGWVGPETWILPSPRAPIGVHTGPSNQHDTTRDKQDVDQAGLFV